eukprot:GEZU01011155.1.p1 GENE.GEZU01011155.1~~GEZU01011155.1.p1  ORF type:complete len:207 (-),score=39.47 GEZU01011155.1:97-717(-)
MHTVTTPVPTMSFTATPPPPPRLTPASPPEGDEENGKKQKKDRIAQHVGPKQNPKSTIFADCAFSFAGRLSKTTKEFVDLVTDHGGQVIMTATKKATHVVTARKFIEEQEKTKDEEGVKLCTNIMFGLKYDIPIVDEHFILDSVNANPPTLAKLKQYDLTAKVGFIRIPTETTAELCGPRCIAYRFPPLTPLPPLPPPPSPRSNHT